MYTHTNELLPANNQTQITNDYKRNKHFLIEKHALAAVPMVTTNAVRSRLGANAERVHHLLIGNVVYLLRTRKGLGTKVSENKTEYYEGKNNAKKNV